MATHRRTPADLTPEQRAELDAMRAETATPEARAEERVSASW